MFLFEQRFLLNINLLLNLLFVLHHTCIIVFTNYVDAIKEKTTEFNKIINYV